MKKIKIAITGNIGSGKSLFSSFIAAKGFTVLNADEISKEILSSNEKIKQRIIKAFGPESFVNNKINKKFLADVVFSNPANTIKINSILHPEVKKQLELKMKEELNKKEIVFVEAALIYEADMEEMFDFVVLVSSDDKLRLERKLSQGFSEKDFLQRDGNQIPQIEKKKRADFIFENNGSENDLAAKANLLLVLVNKSN